MICEKKSAKKSEEERKNINYPCDKKI